jgi:nucleoside-diphosphate-sugar epimerase
MGIALESGWTRRPSPDQKPIAPGADWMQNNSYRRTQKHVVILRVGGIFSPDRLPIERIQRGIPVLNEEECGFINRIHADDLAMICIAAMERGEAGAIYNVSDGHPGTMTGYFYAVADAMGLPRPPALTMAEAQKVLNPSMLSYLTESRRLDNSRMLRELGIRLRYPDLKSGLAHLVSEH